MFEIEDIVGNCPVQAHGSFDGFPFYYRSRHGRWRVEVGKTKDAEPPAFNGTTQIVLEGDDENGGYMAGQGELDIQRIWLAYRKFQEMQIRKGVTMTLEGLMNMKMHEKRNISDGTCTTVMRVPGGWLYRTISRVNGSVALQFVPEPARKEFYGGPR